MTDCNEKSQCLADHKNLSLKLDEVIAGQKLIISGFPQQEDGNPDFGGHKNYHETLIREAKARETFYTELRTDLAKKGLTFVVFALIGLVLIGLQSKLKIWLGA